MIHHRAAAVAVLAVLASTCSDLDNIDVGATGTATIPEGTVIDELLGDFAFLGFDGFDISQSQEFRNQGYSRDQIDSVRVAGFTLAIVDPADANFDFLDSIRFFVEAEGLPRIEIAVLDPVPVGVAAVELELADAELADYATAESMTITSEASGRRPPAETTIEADVTLDVDVRLSGGC